jgi:hypothetical protein
MYTTQLWLGSHPPDTTAHRGISLGQVSSYSVTLNIPYLRYVVLAVKVWDIVGEDRTLKGEYKVLSGRM